MAEVESLKAEIDREGMSKKKSSKGKYIFGGIIAVLIVSAMAFSPEPLSPEEIAAKEAIEKEDSISRLKTALAVDVLSGEEQSYIDKYNELLTLDETSALAFSDKYSSAKNIIEKRNAKNDAERKERERLAKLNFTGNFYIGNYVDEFGDDTGQRFVGYKGNGKFSNSATQNSALKFWIAIDSETDFDLSLYEYAGTNPVKDIFGGDKFKIRFRYDDITGNLTCSNAGDRISCGPQNSAKLINAMKTAGRVQFSIYNARTTSSQYYFEVNANGFTNAMRILNE